MINNYSLINSVIVVLVNIIGVWLAILVYGSDRKSKINQLVIYWITSSLLYIDFGYLSEINNLVEFSLLLKRIRFAAVCCFFVSGYFFYIYFPIKTKKNTFFEVIYIFSWLLMIALSLFTPMIISNINKVDYGVDVIFGNGIIAYYLLTIVSIFFLFSILFKKYFALPNNEKLQVQYFLIGASLFAIFNLIFNILFPIYRHNMKFYQFGDYSTIFLMSFTTYAIIKRKLFGIRVILTQALVGVTVVLLLTQALMANSWLEFSWKFLLFISFLYFGRLLIGSVVREIQQREEIERLSNAKSEFISIASHQLRTPLTAIKGYISMVLEGTYGKLPEKARKPVKNVYDSNEKLVKLVSDLLSFSRLESGKIEVEKEKTSIGDLISNIVEMFKIEAENKGLYLKFEKPTPSTGSGQAEIMIDSDKIRDAISNLINNAIKYTPKGGITVKIQIRQPADKIKIEVSDTGVGMTKEEISRLFQSFSREAASSKLYSQGTGLGLYIAKKYIEMHGGTLTVVSPGPGKGTTFTIELPVG